ncbi:hypothetical protein E4U57_008222 [Claviceps arundinis]|uniref:BZIP domain-containing protein n=1 Tax=Claviceps arundinis TaxID=1623583 RepID=A0ABQ7PFH7_9HYPO|nr:hypothetical protein E4U57_008222 [Claviceps arundinis]
MPRANLALERTPSVPPETVKISSQDTNIISTPHSPYPAHLSVDLDFSSAIESNRSNSFSTANISAQDFSVFNTDSQSIWLPNFRSSPPVASAHQLQQLQSPVEHQQDFVLFDSPQPCQAVPNQPSSLSSQHIHSYHNRRDTKLVAAAAQNQRVAQLLQAFGQTNTSLSVNANRFAHQFHASSSPTPFATLKPRQRNLDRPPVPLFHQSPGSVPQSQAAKMMNAADVDLDEFTPFEGGASAFSSPAISSVMDFGGGISSSASTLGTVSPHDLLVQDPFSSAPSSAALTALTSPSLYNESPDIDSFDASPNFGNVDFDGTGDSWYPLFPDESSHSDLQFAKSDLSLAEALSDKVSAVVDQDAAVVSRKKAAVSPSSGRRHSSIAGVNPRKRDKPLPPIIIEDPNDTTAMKRARNTLAARKSRERKAMHVEDLMSRIATLEAECDHWKSIALSLSQAGTE